MTKLNKAQRRAAQITVSQLRTAHAAAAEAVKQCIGWGPFLPSNELILNAKHALGAALEFYESAAAQGEVLS